MTRRHYLPDIDLVELAIEARFPADHARLVERLSETAAEDVRVSIDAESGQIILKAKGEAQIKARVQTLTAGTLQINVGAAQVSYRECLVRSETVDYTHKRQTGGSGQFARVRIQFSPDDGSGVVFKQDVVGGAVMGAHIDGVKKGVVAAFENGVIAGFPVVDSQAILLDGAYHELDSNALTFEIAARAAVRELRHTGAVVLLEPMMRVAVTCAPEHGPAVARDLVDRRAEETRGLTGLVPLATMLGYESDLARLIGDDAAFTLIYDHHRDVEQDEPGPFRPAMAMRA
jgi:elongation factor G